MPSKQRVSQIPRESKAVLQPMPPTQDVVPTSWQQSPEFQIISPASQGVTKRAPEEEDGLKQAIYYEPTVK